MIFDDVLNIESKELSHLFLGYCTFVSLTQGKKLNIANVFLLMLKNKYLRDIFKKRLELESDYEAVVLFLKFDPSLYKSKYIIKYLNKAGNFKIK